MRYEGKHKYFKKMAQTIGNFKNIAKTVAVRHQRFMCYKLTCCLQFLGVPNTYGAGNSYPACYLHYASLTMNFYTATSISVDQLEYSAPLLLVSDVDVNSTVYRFVLIKL